MSVIIAGIFLAAACDESKPEAEFVGPQPTLALQPCCNGDGPGCAFCQPAGFNNGGDWNPNGVWIQDVAIDTVGTAESCWDDTGDWSGKPYYQMVMGMSDRNAAIELSCMLEILSVLPGMADMYPRMAWCSETVSYWHREAGIPYRTGYRNSSWLFDWQLVSTSALRDWYEAEELMHQFEDLPLFDFEGRGRWISWAELDYQNFEPGINGPLPGAYVCLKCYDDMGGMGAFLTDGHSMIVNDMTIYRTATGKVDHVKITVLEGNTSVGVNDSRSMENILDYTPFGNDYFGDCDDGNGKKIIGFGIDLDADGDPIYDSSRLHYVTVPAQMAQAPILVDVLNDEPEYALAIADYAKLIGENGGIKVASSTHAVPASGVPDGEREQWRFNKDDLAPLSAPVEIVVDLVAEHPVPIKGVELNWQGSFVPDGYDILWAGEEGKYRIAQMPTMENLDLNKIPKYSGPIPSVFGTRGQSVRYIKFSFPPNIFKQDAVLGTVRIVHDWGPDTDADVTVVEDKPQAGKPPKTTDAKTECPSGCFCMDKRAAENERLVLCQDEEIRCVSDDPASIPEFCYQKPEKQETLQCPDGCRCMTEAEARKARLSFCRNEKSECSTGTSRVQEYCYQAPNDPTGNTGTAGTKPDTPRGVE